MKKRKAKKAARRPRLGIGDVLNAVATLQRDLSLLPESIGLEINRVDQRVAAAIRWNSEATARLVSRVEPLESAIQTLIGTVQLVLIQLQKDEELRKAKIILDASIPKDLTPPTKNGNHTGIQSYAPPKLSYASEEASNWSGRTHPSDEMEIKRTVRQVKARVRRRKQAETKKA